MPLESNIFRLSCILPDFMYSCSSASLPCLAPVILVDTLDTEAARFFVGGGPMFR